MSFDQCSILKVASSATVIFESYKRARTAGICLGRGWSRWGVATHRVQEGGGSEVRQEAHLQQVEQEEPVSVGVQAHGPHALVGQGGVRAARHLAQGLEDPVVLLQEEPGGHTREKSNGY